MRNQNIYTASLTPGSHYGCTGQQQTSKHRLSARFCGNASEYEFAICDLCVDYHSSGVCFRFFCTVQYATGDEFVRDRADPFERDPLCIRHVTERKR